MRQRENPGLRPPNTINMIWKRGWQKTVLDEHVKNT